MKKKLEPIKIKATNGYNAWMYVDQKSIEIFIEKEGVGVLSAKITEKRLRSLLNQE